MGGELLDDTQDGDLGAIRAHPNPGEPFWFENLEIADEHGSLLLERRNGGISVP